MIISSQMTKKEDRVIAPVVVMKVDGKDYGKGS